MKFRKRRSLSQQDIKLLGLIALVAMIAIFVLLGANIGLIRSFPATVILLGFITQWLPWSQITRVLFMYHMFGGLIFMILALAFVLTQVAENLRPPGRRLLVLNHLALAVVFFFYFYPVWTGLPISGPANFIGPETPPWGPKIWLVNCRPDLRPEQPQLFCWN